MSTDKLLARLREGVIKEVIIALNTTLDGETTVCYLMDMLSPLGITVTTLAQGVPKGGELDYLDQGTIAMAFSHRKKVTA